MNIGEYFPRLRPGEYSPRRLGGGACLWISILFLLSDGECYYNDKTIDFFFHIFSDVAIGPKFTKLKLNIIDCYVILLILTFNYYKEARNPAIDRSGRSLYLYTVNSTQSYTS